jgi:phosphatidylglycerophosphate synthase
MTASEGELWTQRVLVELRAGRYRPAAWARFLAESLRRAGEVRRERPGLARQARAWSAAGVVALFAARELLAARGLPAPRRASALGWWGATALMLDWHLGMVEVAESGPRRLSAGDALSLLRTALVPFVAAAERSPPLFLFLLGTAAVSDLADGPLARRAGSTRLGRDLDPAADVVLLTAAAGAARRAGWLPLSAARLLAFRSAAPVLALTVGYFARAERAPAGRVGHARWTSPLVYGGLVAGALGRPCAAAALVTGGSLGAVASLPGLGARPELSQRRSMSRIA